MICNDERHFLDRANKNIDFASCCEHGDETSGSGATELVKMLILIHSSHEMHKIGV
jgi:hypothetical protein